MTARPERGSEMVQLTDQQFRAKHEALDFMNRELSAFTDRKDAGQPEASIIGVGIGQESVRMYIEEGPLPARPVPEAFNGLQTMLIQTSGFMVAPVPGTPTAPVRPAPCGVSVGHHNDGGNFGLRGPRLSGNKVYSQEQSRTRGLQSRHGRRPDCSTGASRRRYSVE